MDGHNAATIELLRGDLGGRHLRLLLLLLVLALGNLLILAVALGSFILVLDRFCLLRVLLLLVLILSLRSGWDCSADCADW